MKTIIAIDPGTISGVTIDSGGAWQVMIWKHKTKPKTKKRSAEPKPMRLLKLWRNLEEYVPPGSVIVYEGAKGFTLYKLAVKASHQFRAVIELYAMMHDCQLIEIQPNDLKGYALGKRSGEKDEMIRAAQRRGYTGQDDNEADSWLIMCWYQEYYERE